MPPRVPLPDRPLTYGAVGATRRDDLVINPPAGFRGIERRVRLGEGAARWTFATTELMTWGLQRRSGMRVIRSEDRGPDAPLQQGDNADVRIAFGPLRIGAPVRVVYIVVETERVGFGYGTLPGHPECGEEAWIVDRRPDGSVWLTIRAFSHPATPALWAVYPILRLTQEFYTRRYERALAGPLDG
jgi:uncharacterized protein (UPF0548 family)